MSAEVVKIATGGVKKGKNQGLKVVTANDLFTGVVIYWSKGDLWTEELSDALAVEGTDALTALEKAVADEKAAVGPYLMDVEPDLSPSGRGRLRETIRDRGPTVHPEFGRQAEGI